MGGRKQNTQFNELGFMLRKSIPDNGAKYVAYCTLCKKILKNTGAKRLISHRNICGKSFASMKSYSDDDEGNFEIKNIRSKSETFQSNGSDNDAASIASASYDLKKRGNLSPTDNSIESRNTTETEHEASQEDNKVNNSYSSFNSSIDMGNCSSSTPINLSTTPWPSDFIKRIYAPDSIHSDEASNTYNYNEHDANALVGRLRTLLSETLDKVELCSYEIHHIIAVLRRNGVIE